MQFHDSFCFERRDLRELCNRLMLEDLGDTQWKTGISCTLHNVGRQQRIAAQSKEVVMDAHALDAQDARPNPSESPLRRRPRGHKPCLNLKLLRLFGARY